MTENPIDKRVDEVKEIIATSRTIKSIGKYLCILCAVGGFIVLVAPYANDNGAWLLPVKSETANMVIGLVVICAGLVGFDALRDKKKSTE